MPGGHQAAGQNIDQTADAELCEEMGIHTLLTLREIILARKQNQSEFCYLYFGVHDGPYGFDKNEVAQVKAFDCQKLLAGEYKDYDVLPHVYRYIERLRDIWEPLTIKP
jgi:ADP-ribose pyrophosphatase YjhB (NUDIX family)